jgi:hypothetical protein
LCIRIGFNADPDPAFYHSADPDPDPRSQTYAYADPCRSGSGSWSDLKVTKVEFFMRNLLEVSTVKERTYDYEGTKAFLKVQETRFI